MHFGGLDLESDRLRENLSTLATRLAKALTIVEPKPSTASLDFKSKVCTPYFLQYPLLGSYAVEVCCSPAVQAGCGQRRLFVPSCILHSCTIF